jgi:hypothetical protein
VEIKLDWEFGVLGVYNYKKPGKLDGYFNFIRSNHLSIEGDICEVGVYRGASIIATALLLKELNSDKKVYGFDSFSGFPSYHKNDNLSIFEDLFRKNEISKDHYQNYLLNRVHKESVLGCKVESSTISTSADFSETSISLLEKKINYLGLDNIILVDGDYKNTMTNECYKKQSFMSALIDCDLYESHKISLPFVWDRLSSGGYMFLDEYYSLKFPGARIATNEFFDNKKDKPQMYTRKLMDFERWFVCKEG